MVKVQRLFAKTNLKIHVCRTDKNPLGTKGRTSILSYREYHASCGAVFSVSRRKLLDRECCVTSFRQGSYTPLRRLHVYPLWTCRPQTVLTNRPPPASLNYMQKTILHMIAGIRRIRCFMNTALSQGGRFFIRQYSFVSSSRRMTAKAASSPCSFSSSSHRSSSAAVSGCMNRLASVRRRSLLRW